MAMFGGLYFYPKVDEGPTWKSCGAYKDLSKSAQQTGTSGHSVGILTDILESFKVHCRTFRQDPDCKQNVDDILFVFLIVIFKNTIRGVVVVINIKSFTLCAKYFHTASQPTCQFSGTAIASS